MKEHLNICREEDDVSNIMNFNTANYDSDEDDADDPEEAALEEYVEGV